MLSEGNRETAREKHTHYLLLPLVIKKKYCQLILETVKHYDRHERDSELQLDN